MFFYTFEASTISKLLHNTDLYIGKLIQETLQEKGISASWLAKKIHCHKTNMYKIFQKKYIDTELLERISIALDTDFFSFHSDIVNKKREQNKMSEKR